MTQAEARITVTNLSMACGSFVIQRDLTFTVLRGDYCHWPWDSGGGEPSRTEA